MTVQPGLRSLPYPTPRSLSHNPISFSLFKCTPCSIKLPTETSHTTPINRPPRPSCLRWSKTQKAYGSLSDQAVGRQVHCHLSVCQVRAWSDVSVGTSLVDMYMKTEGVVEGRRVFEEMRERNVMSWTSLISGYARNGLNEEALELFGEMGVGGNNANPFTYVAVHGALADEEISPFCRNFTHRCLIMLRQEMFLKLKRFLNN